MRKYYDIDGFYNYTRNSVEEFGSPDKGGNFWKGYQIIRSSCLGGGGGLLDIYERDPSKFGV
jgi:hypothetical protein